MKRGFTEFGLDRMALDRAEAAVVAATVRGTRQMSSRTGIEIVINMAANLDEGRKRTRVHRENWREIVEDMELGMLVEEMEGDALERIEYEHGTEEVVYVGSKTQSVFTPKKEKEGTMRAFWSMLRPVQEEAGEVGKAEEAQDQEQIIFGGISLESPESSRSTTPSPEKKGKGRRMASEVPATPTQKSDWGADETEVDRYPITGWG